MTPEILIDATELPGVPHVDPADRMIIAAPRHHGFVLVSRDRKLIGYGEQGDVRTITR